MQKRILSIYVNLQDRELNLPRYLNDVKFIISICPSSIMGGKFPDRDVKKVKNILKRNYGLLGQRGYFGRCKYNHNDGTDPWHENFCLHNEPIGLEDQLEFITKGREVLAKTFGIEPLIYAPINHLYDENTLAAIQILKYRFMMDQNNVGKELRPYERHGVIIIPEAPIEKNGTLESLAIYTHLDTLYYPEIAEYIKKFKYTVPFGIMPEEIPEKILRINEIKKRIRKLERDERKLKGFAG